MDRTSKTELIPIVLLSAFYKPFSSGAEKCVEEMVKLPRGRRFVVITSRLDKKLPVRDRDGEAEIIRVGFGTSWDKFLYPVLCLGPALRLRPTIVHAVMESYAGIGLVLLKWLRPKLQTILTLQSGNLDEDAKLKTGFLAWLWKKIHTVPDEITAISQFLADRAATLRGSRERVQVIPNGVDLSTIRSVRESSVPGRIVSIARLSPEKGVDVLIRALASVKARVANAELHLIGDGAQRAELEALVKQLKLENSIVFHGRQPYPEAMRLLTTGSVFALLSHGEGQGIVLLEAGAACVPSVATAVGGIPEMIQEGKTGFLIPDNASDQAADRLVRLLQDESMRKQFGEAARKFAEGFVWERCIDRYVQLWNRLDSYR